MIDKTHLAGSNIDLYIVEPSGFYAVPAARRFEIKSALKKAGIAKRQFRIFDEAKAVALEMDEHLKPWGMEAAIKGAALL